MRIKQASCGSHCSQDGFRRVFGTLARSLGLHLIKISDFVCMYVCAPEYHEAVCCLQRHTHQPRKHTDPNRVAPNDRQAIPIHQMVSIHSSYVR